MTVGYCMKCKTKREMVNVEFITTKTGNKAAKGQCKKCNTNMYAMLPKTDATVSKSKKSKKSAKSKSKKSKKPAKSKTKKSKKSAKGKSKKSKK